MDRERHSSLVHPLEVEHEKGLNPLFATIGGVVVIFFGITTGYLASNRSISSLSFLNLDKASVKKIVGTKDIKTFSDSAEGVLESGGIDGEGTHQLVRPGGPSQTVYLTSSVVDLDLFMSKKIRVWGETFAAQKAGWLMDVGIVEVLE